jgi:hypothetical protein
MLLADVGRDYFVNEGVDTACADNAQHVGDIVVAGPDMPAHKITAASWGGHRR